MLNKCQPVGWGDVRRLYPQAIFCVRFQAGEPDLFTLSSGRFLSVHGGGGGGGGNSRFPWHALPASAPFLIGSRLKFAFPTARYCAVSQKKSYFTWLPPPWVSRLPSSFLPPPVDFPPSLLTGSRLPAPSPQPSHHMYTRSAVLAPLALW